MADQQHTKLRVDQNNVSFSTNAKVLEKKTINQVGNLLISRHISTYFLLSTNQTLNKVVPPLKKVKNTYRLHTQKSV